MAIGKLPSHAACWSSTAALFLTHPAAVVLTHPTTRFLTHPATIVLTHPTAVVLTCPTTIAFTSPTTVVLTSIPVDVTFPQRLPELPHKKISLEVLASLGYYTRGPVSIYSGLDGTPWPNVCV